MTEQEKFEYVVNGGSLSKVNNLFINRLADEIISKSIYRTYLNRLIRQGKLPELFIEYSDFLFLSVSYVVGRCLVCSGSTRQAEDSIRELEMLIHELKTRGSSITIKELLGKNDLLISVAINYFDGMISQVSDENGNETTRSILIEGLDSLPAEIAIRHFLNGLLLSVLFWREIFNPTQEFLEMIHKNDDGEEGIIKKATDKTSE